MNRIKQVYCKRVSKLNDPCEIIEKLRKLKASEVNTTPGTLRKSLYTIKYLPHKENASDFYNYFDEIIQEFECLSEPSPLSEEEQRDAFYNAISQAVGSVSEVDFLRWREHGTRLSYEDLKDFIVQDEARSQGHRCLLL